MKLRTLTLEVRLDDNRRGRFPLYWPTRWTPTKAAHNLLTAAHYARTGSIR